jgi:predicted RNase H-like nuclease (RuvC/YqgF family)
METEKCAAIDQVPAQCGDRGVHGAAPAKDEKLEAFQWRAMTMDVEATWVRCRIQQMEARLAQQEQHNASLESILLDRERENKALKEQLEELQAQIRGVAICAGEDENKYVEDDHCLFAGGRQRARRDVA